MYYTYSRHRTREAAEAALEDYYAYGETSDAERPRIIREQGRWAVQFFDGSYFY